MNKEDKDFLREIFDNKHHKYHQTLMEVVNHIKQQENPIDYYCQTLSYEWGDRKKAKEECGLQWEIEEISYIPSRLNTIIDETKYGIVDIKIYYSDEKKISTQKREMEDIAFKIITEEMDDIKVYKEVYKNAFKRQLRLKKLDRLDE